MENGERIIVNEMLKKSSQYDFQTRGRNVPVAMVQLILYQHSQIDLHFSCFLQSTEIVRVSHYTCDRDVESKFSKRILYPTRI